MVPNPNSFSPFPETSLLGRALAWARARRMGRWLAIFLSIAALSSAVGTYIAISRSDSPFGPDPTKVIGLVIINLALFLALLAVVARRAIWLWSALRAGAAGSRLQTRILVMFSLVTIVPTVMVSGFSAVFFNAGIQSWFDTRVSTAINESVAVAEAYLQEHKEIIRADAVNMSVDLNNELHTVYASPTLFNQIVTAQAALRSLTEALVFQRNRILAQTRLTFSLAFEQLPPDAIERAASGEVVILMDDTDRVRALVKLDAPDTFLLIGRLVDSKVIAHMSGAQSAVNEYRQLNQQKSHLQIAFSAVFVLVTLVLLLAALWYGMVFAGKLMVPIERLIRAAEHVRAGDFTAKVETGREDDEISTLGRAFNRMTQQLETQRTELITANRELDERRRFIEAVLAGVSAGVIALDRDKRITLYNRSTPFLLPVPASQAIAPDSGPPPLTGHAITSLMPQIAELLAQAEQGTETPIQGNITVTRDSKVLTLHVRITVERFAQNIEGFIVTIDDITQLVTAQRSAAWADVARRVAHEIKNPLTPIQLAAERLKKKFLPQIASEDSENYLKYIDTIARHVGDIGRMVEEFVSFARMPTPVFRREMLGTLARKAIFSEQVAHPDIAYRLDMPEQDVPVICDEQQLGRVLTNLLKNAAEAIESHCKQGDGAIQITLKKQDKRAVLTVSDNGPGFPPELFEKLTDPYVTTRARGSGLGLAIVKKTMEDHKGSMQLANLSAGGASVTLYFSASDDINITNDA